MIKIEVDWPGISGAKEAAPPLPRYEMIAHAMLRFASHEYGKLNRRELDRICNTVQSMWPEFDSDALYKLRWIRHPDTECWTSLVAGMSQDELALCKGGALNIARGSGRRPIQPRMLQRIDELFAGAPCDNLEYTYRDHLAAIEEEELRNPPWKKPCYRIRVTKLIDAQEIVDVAVIPHTASKWGFGVYLPSTEHEDHIRYEDIREIISLADGEILGMPEFFANVSGGEIPTSIKLHKSLWVCRCIGFFVREMTGAIRAPVVDLIRAAASEDAGKVVSSEDVKSIISSAMQSISPEDRFASRSRLTTDQMRLCHCTALQICDLLKTEKSKVRADQWFLSEAGS